MGGLVNDVYQVTGALVARKAAEQGGVITGDNPAAYSDTDPLRLWVIQVVIILGVTQILSMIFARIRQPRVIAEVIGGVILGPTVMGRIPHFTDNIFPTKSLPLLTLTANIGLVFFLFVVGMEVDFRMLRRNVKSSLSVSIAGLVVPLSFGAALAVPLYHEFVDPKVNYGYFILFVAVAIGITAFPVLCRILTETKLIDTTVGVVTLAAGVGNDVVGWILLALTVALVNASNGVNAVYVLLASVGFVIFLLVGVQRAYVWLARRTGSLASGQPSNVMMTITLVIVLASAFFTDIIGVHAIFGGFLAGLIIPKQNGYAIAIVEKIEDLIVIIFLPLYFTLSGLKTNLGLLNDGVTWGYVILICVFAFVSKFVSCSLAAKFTGFNLREAGAIGALMSCKGLVELIVLNVGLSAGVMDTRVFSMFVVHALVLTFITTPLTLWIYPARIRKLDKDNSAEDSQPRPSIGDEFKTRFTVVLDKMEQLPAAMSFTQLLQNPFLGPAHTNASSSSGGSVDEKATDNSDIPELPASGAPHAARSLGAATTTIDALRLITLTDRTSAVLRSAEANSLLRSDPVLSIFRTFGRLNRLLVAPALSIAPDEALAESVAEHARTAGSQMVVLPWTLATSDEIEGGSGAENPFRALIAQDSANVNYTHHLRRTFAAAGVDVGVFVDTNAADAPAGSQHVFMPFFGGPDDRATLAFIVQLCANANVSATVVRINKADGGEVTPMDSVEQAKHNTIYPDTVYGHHDTTARLQSSTADDLLWEKFSSPSSSRPAAIASALSRMTFTTQTSSTPLRTVIDSAKAEAARYAHEKTLLVALGRSRRMAVDTYTAELAEIASAANVSAGTYVQKTLGDVAAAVIVGGVHASLLVVQAAHA